ncbi:MAG: Asp-tRNA(Asn)/Glu-tRNA(Gln) amidotransferase subunit GatA, partial [Calditrichaeota bacterium]|nr:Asp-tRNA(Asn)/Glu-tRNA(Gln) amidotransferase subunit GatA [Calditrichota bacterium]
MDVLENRLKTIEARASLNAFIQVYAAEAQERAAAIDAKRAGGKSLGPLAGLIVALKDNICLGGQRTTCGSRILENFVSPYDATVVRKILAADGLIIGKTNLDEFAMGSSSENSHFGAVRHPLDESRVAGGSSGGSAVAVAAGIADLALGSDTGGSIRQPAAFCGIAGLKPTYGRVSRYGLVAYASSLDQIGPFAATVADAAWMLGVIAGRDPNDSTSLDEAVPDYQQAFPGDVQGLKIALHRQCLQDGLDEEVKANLHAAIAYLREGGARVEEI